MDVSSAAVIRLLVKQFGIITRAQALAAGMSSAQITRWVNTGRWIRLHPGIYRSCDAPPTPEGTLLAACFATGGHASHESAGALWGLIEDHPVWPVVTTLPTVRSRRPGVTIHRREAARVSGRLRNIPCTTLATTVLDLAAVLAPPSLDDVVDRALARPNLQVFDLVQEADRPINRGQRGRRSLLRSLDVRGYLGGPSPSVLESKTLRLLASGGIHPLGREVVITGDGWTYRIDFSLAERLALEVDGYAYHARPEAMGSDLRRRRRLARFGLEVLPFTWLDVIHDGPAVLAEVQEALARHTGRKLGSRQRIS